MQSDQYQKIPIHIISILMMARPFRNQLKFFPIAIPFPFHFNDLEHDYSINLINKNKSFEMNKFHNRITWFENIL